MFPTDLFADLQTQCADLLTAKGYRAAKVERNGPFGSCHAEFHSPHAAISIVWDGKEEWLTLSERSIGNGHAQSVANELFFERFPGLAVRRTSYEVAVEQLLAALARHLSNVA